MLAAALLGASACDEGDLGGPVDLPGALVAAMHDVRLASGALVDRR